MSAVLQRPDGRPSVDNAETPPPQVGLDLGITASLQGHSKTDLWHIGGGGGGETGEGWRGKREKVGVRVNFYHYLYRSVHATSGRDLTLW